MQVHALPGAVPIAVVCRLCALPAAVAVVCRCRVLPAAVTVAVVCRLLALPGAVAVMCRILPAVKSSVLRECVAFERFVELCEALHVYMFADFCCIYNTILCYCTMSICQHSNSVTLFTRRWSCKTPLIA